MRLIGHNLTKISAEKSPKFKIPYSINHNMEFKDIIEEKVSSLKNIEALKILFTYKISYETTDKKPSDLASINFEGSLIFDVDKDEAKDIISSWKKREKTESLKVAVLNILLQKCAPKAIQLEEALNLPLHLAVPLVRPEKKN